MSTSYSKKVEYIARQLCENRGQDADFLMTRYVVRDVINANGCVNPTLVDEPYPFWQTFAPQVQEFLDMYDIVRNLQTTTFI